jgi:prepilin signal peptidase PulO-like enzyme (type II secretory pathway)
LVLIALRKRDLQGHIPYGPYIALGAIIWLFAQDPVLAIMAGYIGNVKSILTLIFKRG